MKKKLSAPRWCAAYVTGKCQSDGCPLAHLEAGVTAEIKRAGAASKKVEKAMAAAGTKGGQGREKKVKDKKKQEHDGK